MDQVNIVKELVDREYSMVAGAEKKYGDFWFNAINLLEVFGHYAKSIDVDRFIFAAFLSHLQKHYMLAIFSAVRLHHVQAGMNIRQMVEAGSWAAYAIYNPEDSKFCVEKDGILDIPDNLKKSKDKWLDHNHKDHSEFLRNIKNSLNKSIGHANLIYTMKSFKADFVQHKFQMSFFDFDNEKHVKSVLWSAADVAIKLLDLFYGINMPLNVIKFQPDFLGSFIGIRAENDRLKTLLEAEYNNPSGRL